MSAALKRPPRFAVKSMGTSRLCSYSVVSPDTSCVLGSDQRSQCIHRILNAVYCFFTVTTSTDIHSEQDTGLLSTIWSLTMPTVADEDGWYHSQTLLLYGPPVAASGSHSNSSNIGIGRGGPCSGDRVVPTNATAVSDRGGNGGLVPVGTRTGLGVPTDAVSNSLRSLGGSSTPRTAFPSQSSAADKRGPSCVAVTGAIVSPLSHVFCARSIC